MMFFTPQELATLAQDAAKKGRVEELKVLLGVPPLLWRYTHRLVHEKREVADKVTLWKNTRELLQNITSTLKKLVEGGVDVDGAHFNAYQTALSILRLHVSRVHLSRKVEYVVPGGETTTQTTSAVVLSHSRAVIIHPERSLRASLDWTVNPHVVQAIQEAYQQEQIHTIQTWVEDALHTKPEPKSAQVLHILQTLSDSLDAQIHPAEAHLTELDKQIEEQTLNAQIDYEKIAMTWFTTLYAQVKHQETQRLIDTKVSVGQYSVASGGVHMEIDAAPLIQEKIRATLTTYRKPEHSPILSELKAAQVPLETVDSHHYNLLHLVFLCPDSSPRKEMAAYLIAGGAEVEYPNTDGNTPAKVGLALREPELVRIIANGKVENVLHPAYPDIKWYLTCYCPAFLEKGPRELRERADTYQKKHRPIEDAKKWRAVLRASYEFFFVNTALVKRNLEDASFVANSADIALIDGNHRKLVKEVHAYKEKIKLGFWGEENNEFWRDIIPILQQITQGCGSRENQRLILESKSYLHHLQTLQIVIKKQDAEKEATQKQLEQRDEVIVDIKGKLTTTKRTFEEIIEKKDEIIAEMAQNQTVSKHEFEAALTQLKTQLEQQEKRLQEQQEQQQQQTSRRRTPWAAIKQEKSVLCQHLPLLTRYMSVCLFTSAIVINC